MRVQVPYAFSMISIPSFQFGHDPHFLSKPDSGGSLVCLVRGSIMLSGHMVKNDLRRVRGWLEFFCLDCSGGFIICFRFFLI